MPEFPTPQPTLTPFPTATSDYPTPAPTPAPSVQFPGRPRKFHVKSSEEVSRNIGLGLAYEATVRWLAPLSGGKIKTYEVSLRMNNGSQVELNEDGSFYDSFHWTIVSAHIQSVSRNEQSKLAYYSLDVPRLTCATDYILRLVRPFHAPQNFFPQNFFHRFH